MDDQPDQPGEAAQSAWTGTSVEPPTRPLWLDPPASPPQLPASPPLPPSPPNPLPPPPPQPERDRAGVGSWLKPAIAGGVVGALVAAAVAGGIVAAHDNNTARPSTPIVSRASTRLGGDKLNVAQVLNAVEKGVVSINVQGTQTNGFQTGIFRAAGSGMVIDSTGLILTNAHVIEGANIITVTLSDGRDLPADLVSSTTTGTDVALVHVRNVSGLDVVKLGDSDKLQVGDDVVAVGNALNLGATPTVTTGIVSALNRSIQADNGENLDGLIQTDAAINHGNSGGPLVDANGEVIGINTAVSSQGQNIGFALSINSVKPQVTKLRNGGGTITVGGFLGVSTSDLSNVVPQVLQRLGITRTDGAFVQRVVSGSGAEAAGLQPGDVITSVAGQSVKKASDVVKIVGGHKPGDKIEIRYDRSGQSHTTTAVLGSKPVTKTGG